MDTQEQWCSVISLTLKALLDDGGEVWRCNVCGAFVFIPVEVAIATPAVWYLHKRPVPQVPQAFRDAFREEQEAE